jgi:hypothetical protein
MNQQSLTHTTEKESLAWYKRVWELLSDYRQKSYTATISHGRKKIYTGIEIFCPKETMDEHVDYIRSLLHGKGYIVEGNKNSETITIK